MACSLIPPFLFDTLHARRVSLNIVVEFNKEQVDILVMEAEVAFNAVNERLPAHADSPSRNASA
jgi:hypothetical protein